MRDLLKWQFVSFFSRGLAMAVGIIQSIVIVRILSVGEYGIVTLAVSIGGAFGIYQHLGLASGSTREISSAKSDSEIFKIFITSVLIRYIVSIPLALILFTGSKYIAISQYGNESLITPLRVFSLILLIQGVQSIFNSVIAGMQKFKQLFVYQVVIAIIGLFLYIPLIYFYRVDGYFYALALFNILASISLGYIAMYPLKGNFVPPTRDDLKRLLRDILSISLGIYFVKIIYTYWQKSGPLLLGLHLSPEEIGLFGFALLYAAKLMMVSDAITDVSLPVLSKKFNDNLEEFKALFTNNFNKVFAFIMFIATTAIFWVKEIFHLLLGGNKYDNSLPYVMPLIIAFVFYSAINIAKSSILIPAKMVRQMLISFILMLLTTLVFYYFTVAIFGALVSMAYAMAVGAFIGVVATLIFSWVRLRFTYIKSEILVLFLVAFLTDLFSYQSSIFLKSITFGVFGLTYIALMFYMRILKKEHVLFLFEKLRKNT